MIFLVSSSEGVWPSDGLAQGPRSVWTCVTARWADGGYASGVWIYYFCVLPDRLTGAAFGVTDVWLSDGPGSLHEKITSG